MRTFTKICLAIGLISIAFGIGLIIVAAGTGGGWKSLQTTSFSESYEGIKRLDLDIYYGNVKIVEGDGFSISADNVIEDELNSYVTDGTWYIKEDTHDYIKFLGFRMPARNVFTWDDDFAPRIIITIPKDFVAEDITIRIAAGNVEVGKISSLTGDFTVEAGKLVIKEAAISENSEYTVGAGSMELEDMNAANITLDCGLGNIELEGTVIGKNDISCGVGNVSLKLNNDPDDFDYEISSGIGKVKINGRKYSSVANEIINNKDAVNSLTLDCGIGSIDVKFD